MFKLIRDYLRNIFIYYYSSTEKIERRVKRRFDRKYKRYCKEGCIVILAGSEEKLLDKIGSRECRGVWRVSIFSLDCTAAPWTLGAFIPIEQATDDEKDLYEFFFNVHIRGIE